MSPFVPRLLRALLMCFKDASWPVRDAACLACGRCVTAFPEESREVLEVRRGGVGGGGREAVDCCGPFWSPAVASSLRPALPSPPSLPPSHPPLQELYALWFAHLWDNIYSVRQDSATALGNAVRAYGDEAVARILPKVGWSDRAAAASSFFVFAVASAATAVWRLPLAY